MIRTLRSEFIKFRTITMNWVLGIIAMAFPLVVTLLTAWVQGHKHDFTGRNLVEVLSSTSYVTVLLVMVLSTSHITNEFGFGTIRPTFAATPQRGRVVAAKAIMLMVFSMLMQAVVSAVGLGLGKVLAERRGSTISFSSSMNAGDNLFVPLVGMLVLTGFAALLGLGIGMLMRSTPLSITTLVLWPLLIEGLLSGLIVLITHKTRAAFWLPFRAGLRMAMVGGGLDFDGVGPSRVAAGVYFGLFSLAVALIGYVSVSRRDA
jgi:ABC-2 type transport system permease protein